MMISTNKVVYEFNCNTALEFNCRNALKSQIYIYIRELILVHQLSTFCTWMSNDAREVGFDKLQKPFKNKFVSLDI